MIDEVLLTPEEKDEVWKAEVKKAGKPSLMGKVWEKALVKAQCLKLLEWLKEYCTNALHNLDGDYAYIRAECPECLAELESKLKEG
ncbi:MAG: hypothetical protein WC428_08030 [Candidatus Paceibacterota bacterium]